MSEFAQEIKLPVNETRFEQAQVEITGIVKDHIREIRFLSTPTDNKQRNFIN